MSTKDRKERLLTPKIGSRGSQSTTFIMLLDDLITHAINDAKSRDGNITTYSLAIIPMLFSAFRCFIIETASFIDLDQKLLNKQTSGSDFVKTLKHFNINKKLLKDSELLQHIRHEIMHPANMPTGTDDNLPDYLRVLKENALLNSTKNYDLLEQICSLKLIAWACTLMSEVVDQIVLTCEVDTSRHYHMKTMAINFSNIAAHFDNCR